MLVLPVPEHPGSALGEVGMEHFPCCNQEELGIALGSATGFWSSWDQTYLKTESLVLKKTSKMIKSNLWNTTLWIRPQH